MKISAVIIAKDEQNKIKGCLDSVSWADEVLVVDTGSTDKTKAIARKAGARVVEYLAGKDYSDWRNKGLSLAKGEWIFYIDADERSTKELKNEILTTTNNPGETFAYAIPRRNFILGKELRYGGWYPDYQKRLFKKTNLKEWTGKVHEEPFYQGELGHFKNALIHKKHNDMSEMIDKTNQWSEVEAALMHKAGHPKMNVIRFASAMTRELWLRMVVKLAFLDGSTGVIYALYQVYSKFISYAKLWEMQIKK